MKTPTRISYFVLTLLLTTCKPGIKGEFVLIYPYTRYFNWTQVRIEHFAVKMDNEILVVDTTYGPESNRFTIHRSEKISDYPTIAGFLNHTLSDFQQMEKDLRLVECAPFFQTYVKQIKEQDTVVVILSDVTPCGTNDKWALKGLDHEIRKLKENLNL
jgi:hypothetical protein